MPWADLHGPLIIERRTPRTPRRRIDALKTGTRVLVKRSHDADCYGRPGTIVRTADPDGCFMVYMDETVIKTYGPTVYYKDEIEVFVDDFAPIKEAVPADPGHENRIGIGGRVRLTSASHTVRLDADTGMVVRRGDWDDYWVVRLDRPALYMHPAGSVSPISAICELADNLEVLRV